jgi:cell fate (sporulation/competence/biofilm development) regulator YmcA (YheA/YmcA/DUF963 family)
MGKTGEHFLQLREIESLSYDHTFTKKEAIKTGTELAKSLVENGEVDLFRVVGNLARLSEVVTAALSELKKADALYDIDKGYSLNGVKFSVANTGDRMDYEFDPIYKAINKKLKDREALLKSALKSDTPLFAEALDEETGEVYAQEVPRIPVKTFGKTTIKLEY